MGRSIAERASRLGLVADIGRSTVRIGLTDELGKLRHDTVSDYDPSAQPTISSAITAFARDAGLSRLPPRCAFAVSGIPRGDTISITNSRWILSRPGLASMFRATPLILNDFAANAWAMSGADCSGRTEAISGRVVDPRQPGTYCIIGIGSGLGVACLSRDENGIVNVLATEAGHMGIMDGIPQARPIVNALRVRDGPVCAESLLSGPGLLAIYNTLAAARATTPLSANLADLLRPGAGGTDPIATEAFEAFSKVLWQFAGNMALAYGAWDGVILTGSIAAALRLVIRRPDNTEHFGIAGPYSRRLAAVPRSLISFKNAELEGAAVAMLMADARMNQIQPNLNLVA